MYPVCRASKYKANFRFSEKIRIFLEDDCFTPPRRWRARKSDGSRIKIKKFKERKFLAREPTGFLPPPYFWNFSEKTRGIERRVKS